MAHCASLASTWMTLQLGEAADTINSRASFQVTLINRRIGLTGNSEFSKNYRCQPRSRLETDWLSSSWIQATKCTLIRCKVNCILSYAGRGLVTTEGSYYPPAFCNGKAALRTVSPISFLPQFKRDTEKLEMVQWSAINVARARAHNLSGDAGELALLRLAKRRARGKPHGSLQLPEGKMTVKPLSVVAVLWQCH